MSAPHEILNWMNPQIRQRIEADYARYAPLLALFEAGEALLEERLRRVERTVTERLAQQLFPSGVWRFPAQTVALPRTMETRQIEISMGSAVDAQGLSWTPCGRGWTRPTEIVGWSASRMPGGPLLLAWEVRNLSEEREAPSPASAPGQLCFVRGDEALTATLARARWAIQPPAGRARPLHVERYRGYLEFEREMAVARTDQRPLEAWLPACFPYSRKFLHLLEAPERAEEARFWDWLPRDNAFWRLVACVEGAIDLAANQESPLLLNAFPVAQMQAVSHSTLRPLHLQSDLCTVPFVQLQGFFAASAITEGAPIRTAIVVDAQEGERERAAADSATRALSVTCSPLADEVRVYSGCAGEIPPLLSGDLSAPGGRRYAVIAPAIGGMNAALDDPTGPAARRMWHQRLLRPLLPTEADLRETLRGLPAYRLCFDPNRLALLREGVETDWDPRTCWDSYLWPTLLSESELPEVEAEARSRPQVPLTPVIRLSLTPTSLDLPAWVRREVASYAASAVSLPFLSARHRIEAQVEAGS